MRADMVQGNKRTSADGLTRAHAQAHHLLFPHGPALAHPPPPPPQPPQLHPAAPLVQHPYSHHNDNPPPYSQLNHHTCNALGRQVYAGAPNPGYHRYHPYYLAPGFQTGPQAQRQHRPSASSSGPYVAPAEPNDPDTRVIGTTIGQPPCPNPLRPVPHPAPQITPTGTIFTTSDGQRRLLMETGSAKDGDRKVFCPQCRVWINHGCNGTTYRQLQEHWATCLAVYRTGAGAPTGAPALATGAASGLTPVHTSVDKPPTQAAQAQGNLHPQNPSVPPNQGPGSLKSATQYIQPIAVHQTHPGPAQAYLAQNSAPPQPQPIPAQQWHSDPKPRAVTRNPYPPAAPQAPVPPQIPLVLKEPESTRKPKELPPMPAPPSVSPCPALRYSWTIGHPARTYPFALHANSTHNQSTGCRVEIEEDEEAPHIPDTDSDSDPPLTTPTPALIYTIEGFTATTILARSRSCVRVVFRSESEDAACPACRVLEAELDEIKARAAYPPGEFARLESLSHRQLVGRLKAAERGALSRRTDLPSCRATKHE